MQREPDVHIARWHARIAPTPSITYHVCLRTDASWGRPLQTRPTPIGHYTLQRPKLLRALNPETTCSQTGRRALTQRVFFC